MFLLAVGLELFRGDKVDLMLTEGEGLAGILKNEGGGIGLLTWVFRVPVILGARRRVHSFTSS